MSVDSADVQARLQRKLQRALARSEAARLAAEAAALQDEAELQRLCVDSAHALNALSGSAALRDTLEFSASAHTQAAAARALGAAQRALDPGTPAADAAAALAAAAAAPPVVHVDAEAEAERARAARLARLLRASALPPPMPAWSTLRPDPVRMGTARECVGTGSPDLSRIPITHGERERNATAPWVPSARSHEATLPPPLRAPGATGTGTWAGHDAIDAPARGAGRALVSTGRPHPPAATSASASRFAHDPIPSHILSTAAFSKAGSAGAHGAALALPRALLNTLTLQQLRAPRHPAYLLDSHMHHPSAWRRPRPAAIKTFSEPPKSAPPTLNDLKRAAVAMVPERSLPASDPVHAGKPAYSSTVHPPPLFSNVPLDYAWVQARQEEEQEAREGVFWQAAGIIEAEGRAAGQMAQGGGVERLAEAGAAQGGALLPAHLLGPSPSPMRGGAARTGEATFRTFSASGMHGQEGLGSTLSRAGSAGAGAGQPALALLTGPARKFQSLRSALVFGSAEACAEYEAARRALGARKALAAHALAQAQAEEHARMLAMEGRLAARGVSTGLGATGSGNASARAKLLASRLKQALEP